MSVLLKDASSQKYFKSAELVQRFIIPPTWGNTKNPYHKYLDTWGFDPSPSSLFRRTTRLTERMLCFTNVHELQNMLSRLMEEKLLATMLKDISSMDDVNAAGVYAIVGNAVSALSLQIGMVDTLGIGERDDRDNPYASQLETLLSNDRSHPLHEILFSENGEVPLDGPYTPPSGKNDGSGLCTLAGVAQWADEKMLVKPEILEVFELGGLFPEEADSNGEGEFPTVRRIATFIDGFMRNFFIALNEIVRAAAKSTSMAVNFETAYVPLLSVLKKSETTDGDLYGYRFSKAVPKDRKDTKVFGIPGLKLELYHYEPAFIARAQFVINDVYFPQTALDEANPEGDPTAAPDFSDAGDHFWVHCKLPIIKEE